MKKERDLSLVFPVHRKVLLVTFPCVYVMVCSSPCVYDKDEDHCDRFLNCQVFHKIRKIGSQKLRSFVRMFRPFPLPDNRSTIPTFLTSSLSNSLNGFN